MTGNCWFNGVTGLYTLLKSEHNATIIDHDDQIIFLWHLSLLTDVLNMMGVYFYNDTSNLRL